MATLVDERRHPHALRLALAAMATRFELVLAGDDRQRLRAIGEAALREIEECEQVISPFRPGSAIARVNREGHVRPVRVDSLTFGLLRRCAELTTATAGAFDITVGPLLQALGFRDVDGSIPAAPDDERLARARSAVGMQHVELDPDAETVRLLRPGMALDLGAIGKGFAIDLAADVLREHGVASALLHGGTSTVLAIGTPPGRSAWRVAIGRAAAAPVTMLSDRALSVSASRAQTCGGHGHVLDARRGAAVVGDTTTAAVLSASATDADAWSTALLALGTSARPPADTTCLLASGSTEAPRWRPLGSPSTTVDHVLQLPTTGSAT